MEIHRKTRLSSLPFNYVQQVGQTHLWRQSIIIQSALALSCEFSLIQVMENVSFNSQYQDQLLQLKIDGESRPQKPYHGLTHHQVLL